MDARHSKIYDFDPPKSMQNVSRSLRKLLPPKHRENKVSWGKKKTVTLGTWGWFDLAATASLDPYPRTSGWWQIDLVMLKKISLKLSVVWWQFPSFSMIWYTDRSSSLSAELPLLTSHCFLFETFSDKRMPSNFDARDNFQTCHHWVFNLAGINMILFANVEWLESFRLICYLY